MYERRKFIAAAGTSMLAATAGCAGLLGGEETDGTSGGLFEDTIPTGGQITGVDVQRNSVVVRVKDSSKVDAVNVFYDGELVERTSVATGGDSASITLFYEDEYGSSWEYNGEDEASYRPGDYRFVAVDSEDKEVGSTEISLTPNLEVTDVHLGWDFVDDMQFRSDYNIEDPDALEDQLTLAGTLIFEIENTGSGSEFVNTFSLDSAESTELTFNGRAGRDDFEDDVQFLNEPSFRGNGWNISLRRWFRESGGIERSVESMILAPGESGYFDAGPMLYQKSGALPVEESLQEVCSSETELTLNGSVSGLAGASTTLALTRTMGGDGAEMDSGPNYDYWCSEQSVTSD